MTGQEQELPVVRKLIELAERVEAATGHDAELDREIWLAAVANKEQRFLVEVGRDAHGNKEANFRTDWMADGARYTASLDAAMSLVPEGLDFGCGRGIDTELGANKTICHAWVGEGEGELVFAETPALALTAACLKARASTGGDANKGKADHDG